MSFGWRGAVPPVVSNSSSRYTGEKGPFQNFSIFRVRLRWEEAKGEEEEEEEEEEKEEEEEEEEEERENGNRERRRRGGEERRSGNKFWCLWVWHWT